MSVVSNHHVEELDQPAAQPRVPQARVPPRRPRPGPIAPRLDTLSAADALGRHTGEVYWYVEYRLRNIKAGRFLAGPYLDRRNAVDYAAGLLLHTEYEHEVEKVTVVPLKAGSARPRREGGGA